MVFGIPMEIQSREKRVGATPELVESLKALGHLVLLESNAGVSSGFGDDDYIEAGATIVPSPEKVYAQAEVILKVQAPAPVEYELVRPEHVLFAYYYMMGNLEMARALMARGCTCCAYDLVTRPDGSQPFVDLEGQLLGHLAVQQAGNLMQIQNGGRGIFLGSVAGLEPASAIVIGESSAALTAARYAAKLGCAVTLLVNDDDAAEVLRSRMPSDIVILTRGEESYEAAFPGADVVISAANEDGGRAPIVVSKTDESLLPRGSIIIDLDIDCGGSVETSTPTTHDNPTFTLNNIIHYCVPNLAGSIPVTASAALSREVLTLFRFFPEHPMKSSLQEDNPFYSSLAIYEGRIANSRLATELSMSYYDMRIAGD